MKKRYKRNRNDFLSKKLHTSRPQVTGFLVPEKTCNVNLHSMRSENPPKSVQNPRNIREKYMKNSHISKI